MKEKIKESEVLNKKMSQDTTMERMGRRNTDV